MKKSFVLLAIFALILPLMFLGCEGDDGSPGRPGTSTGTVSGTVTNSATGTGLEGATVSTDPDQGSDTTVTDGSYSLDLPVGNYTLTFTKDQFGTQTASVSVLAGETSTENATLIPTVPVLVEVDVTGTATPGSTLAATVTATPLDDSTFQSVEWSQKNSVTVTFDDNTATTTNVTLPDLAAYKDELFHVLSEPTITTAQLPAGVTPPAELNEQLLDRFGVQGVDPHALEEAGLVTLVATVTTTSGTYEVEEEIETALPWKQSTGIQNVPINVPVLLHGANQASYDWSVAGPAAVTLDDATAQNPSFTPTTSGVYTVSESVSGASFQVGAGTWAGAIDGLDGNRRPITNSSCSTACHNAIPIVNEIFSEWKESGHAEIFTNNIENPGGHWSLNCAPCHGVGYDTDADNNGWDEAILSDGWVVPPHGEVGLFDEILTDFPNTARLSNIQCENCHGPSNPFGTGLHGNSIELDPERFSLDSRVCGSCHGEPARHGRFQQWQASPHSNYELAIDEHDSGNCSRCHTANGFIAWGAGDYDAGFEVTVTWDDNTVHPQTCAACHDPHDVGTISGDPNNARVRVENDTPILAAGFRVLEAGRGALCMVCHNTRRDLRNDDVGAGDVITAGRAPHGGAQADVLMGQNAFFVTTGIRGKHSLITDTCTRCHMQETPPPALLSYNLGGTNHTFLASRDICAECHDSITADEVQSATQTQMSFLAASLENKLEELILAYAASDTVTLTGGGTLDNVTIDPTDTVTVANYSDSHGRQAVDLTVNGVTDHIQLRNILVNPTPDPDDDDPNIITHQGNGNDGPGETLAKAGWNYLMATNERSHGIHNPTFSFQILAGAQAAVDAIP